ncbi:MAG: DUF5946 family protein [Actinomycetota bacterium]
MDRDDRAYEEVAAYTLSRGDAAFMHQHVVDAYAVQTSADGDKPIRRTQALIGLYLHVEHGLTGREVQRVHKLLADQRPAWPTFVLLRDRGAMSVGDVLAAEPGTGRDRAIEAWARSTWGSCRHLGPEIAEFLSSHGITPPGEVLQGGAPR